MFLHSSYGKRKNTQQCLPRYISGAAAADLPLNKSVVFIFFFCFKWTVSLTELSKVSAYKSAQQLSVKILFTPQWSNSVEALLISDQSSKSLTQSPGRTIGHVVALVQLDSQTPSFSEESVLTVTVLCVKCYALNLYFPVKYMELSA